jgi:NADPH2:quinone reductase
MKAIICSRYDGIEDLQIRDTADPKIASGSVMLRMRAAAINPPDILMAQGLYQVKPPVPFVLGIEGMGTVEAVADDVQHLKPQDRVMVYAGAGCFAERMVAPVNRVFLVPGGMSDSAAAGFVLAYGTAYHALIDCGELAAGQTAVLLGASGGLGLAAIQIAKAVKARVIAVASTPEKRDSCIVAGADDVIGSDAAQLRDHIRSLTNGRGADVILDVVGGDLTDAALRAIAPYGRFVIAGYASGRIPDIRGNLVLLKQAKVVGASYRQLAENQPAIAAANMKRLCCMWRDGLLQPQVTQEYPFGNFIDALKVVRDRKIIGKAALVL